MGRGVLVEKGQKRKRWAGLATAVVVLTVAGLVWFRPWALRVDETVHEALPAASAPAATPTANPGPSASAAAPVTVAQGTFISHEHTTTGTAKVVRLADGAHTLLLEGLDTSNGPDLHVLLSDAPVREGTAGWRVFDDGRYVDLVRLKGDKGDQNYLPPADADWSKDPGASIWCDRFDVSFEAAALARA
ncbi:DM13 domain-containing protein [Streptomyces sp. NPDC000961]|uniref:DM13 domain-containing protein n=1 Tax=Streptomyces sp. NPDC000961 TaxID=3364541 RepID=UPI0036C9491A